MSAGRERGPERYILTGDTTRPKRRWVLRRSSNNVVHWTNAAWVNTGADLPMCHEESLERLQHFLRNSEKNEHPTCLWCARLPMRRERARRYTGT